MTKNKNDKGLDQEIIKVTNPFQAILIILSHPKLVVPLIIIVAVILFFVTIKIIYKDGRYIVEKKELKIDKTLSQANKVKDILIKEDK